MEGGATMATDEDILRRCKAEGPRAAGPLVDRHAAAVRVFLLRKLRDPDRAEEAAQESFVRAISRLGSLRESGRFVSWVLGIAANVANEMARRVTAAARRIEADEPTSVVEQAKQDEVERAVRALPEPYRETVWLRYWGGLACEEVARAQGVPVGTVTKRLVRAHAMLRERLEGQGETKEVEHELRIVP